MNETIGVKGGRNDRRRRLIITRKQKKKLEEYQKLLKERELVELERKVKNIQKITLLKTLPIVTFGQIIKTLTEDEKLKRQLIIEDAIYHIEQENMFSEREKEEIIFAIRNGVVLKLPEELLNKLGISLEEVSKQVSEYNITDIKPDEETIEEPTKKVSIETQVYIQKIIQMNEEKKRHSKEVLEAKLNQEQQNINNDIEVNENIKSSATADLTIEEKLAKLKNHKIIDEYEKMLKEVRTDLRNLIFEYNVIHDASENLYESKEAEELLNRLNEIIKKIEELKRRIDIPNIDKYDDNYLYILVEDYIEEFRNHNFVDEIKDSSLYIMISEKLDELDQRKDFLQSKIETRKEKLEVDEEKLEAIKDNYINYEKFNRELLNFQATQDSILNDIRTKMANATSIQERVEVQVTGMRHQSRRLLALLGTYMMLPGARSARGLATAAATYLYFMRNILRPQRTITRRYKEIKVEDYSKDIEKSIDQLDDISVLLKKTSSQIDATIKEFEKEFKEYFAVLPECQKLLDDLEKVKEEIKEKEYELSKIKYEQEKNLELNNSKVKMLQKN